MPIPNGATGCNLTEERNKGSYYTVGKPCRTAASLALAFGTKPDPSPNRMRSTVSGICCWAEGKGQEVEPGSPNN